MSNNAFSEFSRFREQQKRFQDLSQKLYSLDFLTSFEAFKKCKFILLALVVIALLVFSAWNQFSPSPSSEDSDSAVHNNKNNKNQKINNKDIQEQEEEEEIDKRFEKLSRHGKPAAVAGIRRFITRENLAKFALIQIPCLFLSAALTCLHYFSSLSSSSPSSSSSSSEILKMSSGTTAATATSNYFVESSNNNFSSSFSNSSWNSSSFSPSSPAPPSLPSSCAFSVFGISSCSLLSNFFLMKTNLEQNLLTFEFLVPFAFLISLGALALLPIVLIRRKDTSSALLLSLTHLVSNLSLCVALGTVNFAPLFFCLVPLGFSFFVLAVLMKVFVDTEFKSILESEMPDLVPMFETMGFFASSSGKKFMADKRRCPPPPRIKC